MTEMVKLANGREVTLDEFLTWSTYKQQGNLKPARTGMKISEETRAKMSATKLKTKRDPWNKGLKMTEEYKNKLKALGKSTGRPKGRKEVIMPRPRIIRLVETRFVRGLRRCLSSST